MAKSVIDIDVNDSKFKAFIDVFNKYQKGLKAQSFAWRQASEEVVAITAGMAAMSAALISHNDLIEKGRQAERRAADERRAATASQKKADQDKANADKEKTKAEKAREKREKEASIRTKRAVEDTKKIARGIGDIAVGLAKFAAFDVLGGALALWGIDKFVQSVGDQRRAASGYGVSIGENRALQLSYGRYYDTNSSLESLANAQMDVTKAWIFSGMGIRNPYTQDPADLLLQAGDAARRQLTGVPLSQRLNWAQAHGFDQVFQPDDLRRLISANPNEWSQQRGIYAQAKQLFKLSDQIGERFQTVSLTLAKAGVAIESEFIRTLDKQDLEKSVDRVIGKFQDLAIKVIDRIDWHQLELGLDAFADYLGSQKFQQDFKYFTDSVGQLADNIVKALRYFKLIPDDPQAAAAQQQRYADILAGKIPGNPNMWTFGDFNGEDDGKVSERDLAAMNMLMSPPFGPGGKGWDAKAAANIVSMADAESSNTTDPMGPNGKPQPWGSAHYGTFQLDKTRQGDFNRWAKNLGWPDMAHASLGEQYAFANYELLNNKRFAKVKAELMSQSGNDISMDAASLTAGWMKPFNDGPLLLNEIAKRGNRAATILSVYVNNNIPGPPVPNQVSAAAK